MGWARTHPTWALGFEDEVWWSREAQPPLHTWSEAGQPLMGDADEIAERTRTRMYRHDPGPDLVAHHHHRARPRHDGRQTGRDRAVEDRVDGTRVVAEEGAEPEREAIDQDRLFGRRRPYGGDEVGTHLDRRP